MLKALQTEAKQTTSGYRIALAYSNIQRKHGLPIIVSGVVCTEELLEELTDRKLPNKKILMRRRNKLFNMQMAFDDVSEYLTGHEITKIWKTENLSEDIEKDYIKLINILMKGHLRLLTGNVNSIVLRAPESYDRGTKEIKPAPLSGEFIKKLLEFVDVSNKIVIKGKNQYERLLEVTKILASLEYYRLRWRDGGYILKEIEKSPEQYFQILKVGWNSPAIEEYSDYNVGSPSIVVRTSNPNNIEHVYIKIGRSLYITPLARFCRGTQDKAILPCKKITTENPFGALMIGSASEHCWDCRKVDGFDCSLCLYRKPLCNGFEAKCGNIEFAGNICCNLFAIYITRFGKELKVGTAFFPNIIGRLLEQGASQALILYPFQGIMTVHLLEKQIKNYLREKILELKKYNISKVYTRAPPAEDKLSCFLEDKDGNDMELLSSVKSILSSLVVSIDGSEIDLSQTSISICDFRRNYVIPQDSLKGKFLKSKPLFGPLKGRIIGYRGSFVFLDSGDVVDLRELQGYVVRGRT